MIRTFEAWDGWPALRAQWTGKLAQDDLAALDQVVACAAHWHGDQTRPAGEPYLTHLLEALRVLVDAVGVTDVDVLRAAVLHDIVEDTACAPEEVRERFGDRTADLVAWVTIPPRREGQSKEEARTAYLDRLRQAPDDAIAVKLADRVSNVQRLDTHPRREKARVYYRETVSRILPLAEGHPWFPGWFADWRAEFRWLAEAGPRPLRPLRRARVFDGFEEDGTPLVWRPPLTSADEVMRILGYLRAAPTVLFGRGFDQDAWEPEDPPAVPRTFSTDGTWIWSGAVTYYVRTYGMPVEPDLYEHIRVQDYAPPEVPAEIREAASGQILTTSTSA